MEHLGKPAAFHADNAAEFHSAALDRAVRNQVMDLIWRPGGKKNYGAYIERYLGTLNRRLHELPGTTFRNPQHRGDYDSEGFACMTIDEVEIWLAHIILGSITTALILASIRCHRCKRMKPAS